MQFAVLGYAITSMETETYRPARLILLGEDASPRLRRSTSLDAPPHAPPAHADPTAARAHLPARLGARRQPVPECLFAHGPHSLGLAKDAGEAAIWTTLASAWIHEQVL